MGPNYMFTSINKEEHKLTDTLLKDKKVRVKNTMAPDGGLLLGAAAEDDSDEEMQSGVASDDDEEPRVRRTGDDDDDSEDGEEIKIA